MKVDFRRLLSFRLFAELLSEPLMPPRPGQSQQSVTNGHSPALSFLKERAYEELKRGLLNNDYPPGTFLSECGTCFR